MTKRRLKFRGFCSNSFKQSLQHFTRVRFWSIVSIRGTHFVNSFFVSKCWCKIYPFVRDAHRTSKLSECSASITNCSNRRCTVTIMFFKLLFKLLTRFVFHKLMFNQYTKFVFVSKIYLNWDSNESETHIVIENNLNLYQYWYLSDFTRTFYPKNVRELRITAFNISRLGFQSETMVLYSILNMLYI